MVLLIKNFADEPSNLSGISFVKITKSSATGGYLKRVKSDVNPSQKSCESQI